MWEYQCNCNGAYSCMISTKVPSSWIYDYFHFFFWFFTDRIPEAAEDNVFTPVSQSFHGGGGQGWGPSSLPISSPCPIPWSVPPPCPPSCAPHMCLVPLSHICLMPPTVLHCICPIPQSHTYPGQTRAKGMHLVFKQEDCLVKTIFMDGWRLQNSAKSHRYPWTLCFRPAVRIVFMEKWIITQ